MKLGAHLAAGREREHLCEFLAHADNESNAGDDTGPPWPKMKGGVGLTSQSPSAARRSILTYAFRNELDQHLAPNVGPGISLMTGVFQICALQLASSHSLSLEIRLHPPRCFPRKPATRGIQFGLTLPSKH